MKAGKPGYVEETFVGFDHAYALVLALGGIPCYPVLADGASPICPFEEPVERLVSTLADRHIYCAELIPNRNLPEVLTAYVRGLRAAGIAVLAGTEHNSPEMLPLEPRCAGDATRTRASQRHLLGRRMRGGCAPVPDCQRAERLRGRGWNAGPGPRCRRGTPRGVCPPGSGSHRPVCPASARPCRCKSRVRGYSWRQPFHGRPRSKNSALWRPLSSCHATSDRIPDLVLGGGGNTSVKLGDHLQVKGSGAALASIGPDGFVDLDRSALQRLLDSELSTSQAGSRERVQGSRARGAAAAREAATSIRGISPAPSHAGSLCRPSARHAGQPIQLCSRAGKHLIEHRLADDVTVDRSRRSGLCPGQVAARRTEGVPRATGKERPRAVIMQNHGLVLCGDTADDIREDVEWLFDMLSDLSRAQVQARGPPRSSASPLWKPGRW